MYKRPSSEVKGAPAGRRETQGHPRCFGAESRTLQVGCLNRPPPIYPPLPSSLGQDTAHSTLPWTRFPFSHSSPFSAFATHLPCISFIACREVQRLSLSISPRQNILKSLTHIHAFSEQCSSLSAKGFPPRLARTKVQVKSCRLLLAIK